MWLSISYEEGLVALSAVSPDAEKVKAARRSWRRVAKRVLRSKNTETRQKWLGRLKFITDYMVRRLQQAGAKKSASTKVLQRIEYGKKYVALYKRIAMALAKPYAEGMEKLADVKIPEPGTDIKLKKGDHKVTKTPAKEKPKPEKAAKVKDEPKEDSPDKEGDAIQKQTDRGAILTERFKELRKTVKEKFSKGVKIMGLFEKARDEYSRTKSAASQQKMQLIAKRLGEIKNEIALAKKRRNKFKRRFGTELAPA